MADIEQIPQHAMAPAAPTPTAAAESDSGFGAPLIKRAQSSRFSMVLESSVDYESYRTAYGKQLLQQQPEFECVEDAEEELRCVLHDTVFEHHTHSLRSAMAENVAMAVDWFVSALSRLFDGDEPFQNQNFLRLCCMFFASPLYENNARLVQRHLVKRTYAELSIEATDYEPTLWLLLAFLHLITEFQTDTYGLCRDTGLFPLLARAVRGAPEKHLHVLAMSLMFEIAQAVTLSPTDIDCVTDDTLLYLLDYVERMRYAESDVYNNTGTKLLLALNEQFLKHDGYQSIPQSPLVFNNAGKAQRGLSGARPDSLISTYSLPPPESSPGMSLRTDDTERPQSHAGRVSERSRHSRAESIDIAMASNSCAHSGIDGAAQRPLRHPAVQSIPQEVPVLSRSRSMDLRAQLEAEDGSLIRSASETRDQTVQRVGLRTARTSIASSTTLCRRSSSGHSTPVVELLAQRIDCCKTFTENLVFLLNRETEPSTQVLILHMLYCILTDPSTSCILYTNDMFVLIDIVIRDLANLSDGLPKQRQAYLLVTSAILRNSVYLTTRHRLSDIELCLVNLLRHSLVSSHASASEKHESHVEPPLPPPSMRHFSTPRLSTASDLSIGVPEVKSRRGSGISSPVSSLSSSMSEETCYARRSEDSHSGTWPKVSRRAPPPPPPPLATAAHHRRPHTPSQPSRSPVPPTLPARRRPPPPPPPPSSSSAPHSPLAPSVPGGSIDSTGQAETNGGHRLHRRRAPPPPPPTPMSAVHTPLSASKSSSCAMPSLVPPPQPPMQRSTHRRAGSRAAPPPLPVRAVDKPSDASSGKQTPPPPLPRRARAMSTGIRRQLSVKNSVSKYKRSHRAQPPPVPTSTPAGAPARMDQDEIPKLVVPISPVIESFSETAPTIVHRPSMDLESDDASETEDPKGVVPDTAEERRATRKLVESALRCCHEARVVAATKSLSQQSI